MFEKLLEVQLYACCLGALFLIPAASILIHAASLLLQIYAPMLLTLLHYLPLVSVAIAETIVLISLPVGILFVSVSPAYEMNRGLGTIYGQLLFRATTGAIWLGLGPLCLVGVFLVEFVAFGKVLQSPRELAIISISCQIVEGGDHYLRKPGVLVEKMKSALSNIGIIRSNINIKVADTAPANFAAALFEAAVLPPLETGEKTPSEDGQTVVDDQTEADVGVWK